MAVVFEHSVDELLALFKKYKISIDNVLIGGDTIHLERYGVVIPYSQKELCSKPPKQLVRDIIMKTIQDPDYKAKTEKYVKGLVKKSPIITEIKSKKIELTIDDKKKLIREKLIK
jgi:hypothetical protein